MKTLLPNVFLASVLLAGCFSPPVIQPAGSAQIQLAQFPRGSEEVVLAVGENDELLRGVWIPGDAADAPVVLHFMPTQRAISSGWRGLPQLQILWDLRDRGISSLFVDYRGVGASDGEARGQNLREDAEAMWAEALRRVGDPKRVVLRGNSLGGLAVAALLEQGVDPAAIVIAAPVLDDTVVYNVARDKWGTIVAWVIDALIFRRPVGVDLDVELRRSHAPKLVMVGEKDEYLGETGRARLSAALRENGGTLLIEPGFSHIDAGIEGHYLLPGESDFYTRLFPNAISLSQRVRSTGEVAPSRQLEAVATRWRFDAPAVALALADTYTPTTPAQQLDQVVDWFRNLEEVPEDTAGLEALLDFDDPAGAIDPSELEALRPYAFGMTDGQLIPTENLPSVAVKGRLHRVAYMLPKAPRGFDRVWKFPQVLDIDLGSGDAEIPPRLLLPPEDSLRHVVRLLLKNRGIPDRVVADRDGYPAVEWRRPDGQWSRLEMPTAL